MLDSCYAWTMICVNFTGAAIERISKPGNPYSTWVAFRTLRSEIGRLTEHTMEEKQERHVYSEEEVGRILKRASEMQGSASGKSSVGLTITELQQLAQEADIDPRFIAAAALEVAGSGEEDESNIWGGPLTLTLSRRIEGEIGEATWERIASRSRTFFKRPGATDERGNTREWTINSAHEGGGASVTLHQRDGHAEMEVFWNGGSLGIPFAIIPFILTIISVPILFEGMDMGFWPGAPVWLLVAGVLGTIARTAFGAIASSQRRQIREFTDGLVALVEEERARGAVEQELAEGRAARAAAQAAGIQMETGDRSTRIQLEETEEEEAEGSRASRRTRV